MYEVERDRERGESDYMRERAIPRHSERESERKREKLCLIEMETGRR